MKTRFLGMGLVLCILACEGSTHDKQEDKLPGPAEDLSLAESYRDAFTIGVALKSEALDTADRSLIVRNFNRITAEYEMKWAPMMKGETYDFTAADKLVTFASENNMHLTGHTLIWYLDTPEWVFGNSAGQAADRETLKARMKTHIETTLNHFRGKVDNWDVVNEALADEPGLVYRPSRYFQIYGNEDYIIDAFRFAQEADPNVELWYNDYTLENPAKLAKLLILIQRLKAAGIHLTGIGFQGHYSLSWPSPDLIENAFRAVIAQGLKVKISELDMSVYSDYPDGIFRPEAPKPCDEGILARQAQRYAELFQLFRKYQQNLAHVTVWGLKDNGSWLNSQVKGRADCPLFFDASGQPKPAFFAAFP